MSLSVIIKLKLAGIGKLAPFKHIFSKFKYFLNIKGGLVCWAAKGKHF